MTFPIIPDSPYGEKGYLRGIDPQSDEHLQRVGFKVGYVDEQNGTFRASIIGAGWSASLWRFDYADWQISYVNLPGFVSGSGGPSIASKTLPKYSPWREALNLYQIGECWGCTPQDYAADMAAAAEAESERLYASSYGLGL